MSAGEHQTSLIIPQDLMEVIDEFSGKYAESPRDLVIAAVEHFTRIPEEQRKAVIRGCNMRRKGIR
jgi:hypothetical protein